MTTRDAPEKKDPSDFSVEDVEALLRPPFPGTLEQALADGLPEHDYTVRGHRFWEGHKVKTWIEETLEVIDQRLSAQKAMIEAEHARLEAAYQRRQDAEPKALDPNVSVEALVSGALGRPWPATDETLSDELGQETRKAE